MLTDKENIEKESTKESLIDAIHNACDDVCRTLTIDEIIETIEASKEVISKHLKKLSYSKK